MLIIIQDTQGNNILRNSVGVEMDVFSGEKVVAKGVVEVARFVEEQYDGNVVLCVE